jgi:hypothetical protein
MAQEEGLRIFRGNPPANPALEYRFRQIDFRLNFCEVMFTLKGTRAGS